MKRKLLLLAAGIGLIASLGACTIRYDKEISEDEIDERKEMF